jgi:hypothetical protein
MLTATRPGSLSITKNSEPRTAGSSSNHRTGATGTRPDAPSSRMSATCSAKTSSTNSGKPVGRIRTANPRRWSPHTASNSRVSADWPEPRG